MKKKTSGGKKVHPYVPHFSMLLALMKHGVAKSGCPLQRQPARMGHHLARTDKNNIFSTKSFDRFRIYLLFFLP